MKFKWIRARGALEKCRNCFTRDEMGKQSPTMSYSRVKYTTLSSSLTMDSAKTVQQLKIDVAGNLIVRPQLFHGHTGDKAACKRRIPG